MSAPTFITEPIACAWCGDDIATEAFNVARGEYTYTMQRLGVLREFVACSCDCAQMYELNRGTARLQPLTQHIDGIEGIALGVHGAFQYALMHNDAIYRRPASHAGTYGGWRWECMAEHARAYPSLDLNAYLLPLISEAIACSRR